MRRSFDGLIAESFDATGEDVHKASSLYLFSNKQGDRLKMLWWDGNGYCILYKRLEEGAFRWPRERSEAYVTITAEALAMLLSARDEESKKINARARKRD
jgi:transposase